MPFSLMTGSAEQRRAGERDAFTRWMGKAGRGTSGVGKEGSDSPGGKEKERKRARGGEPGCLESEPAETGGRRHRR
jgi:hypothetical protein